MNTLKKSLVIFVACAIAGTGALGCNTFKGAGKDIQRGGKAVENAANDVQNNKGVQDTRPNTILASANAGGSISPTGSNEVSYGSDRSFTIRPYNGYKVADVIVDGQSVGANARHTFKNVTTSHTISASFAKEANH